MRVPIFLWLAILAQSSLAAESVAATPARLQALSARPEWRALLHVPAGATRSEVNSPAFFLSPEGQGSPEAELQATLAAWDQPLPTPADAHPRCRFPARYRWLGEQLPLPEVAPITCAEYQTWARPTQLRSVSLLMVSGYLGNPASSFGHALLKLDHQDDSGAGRLLDRAFNFGARVPEDEPPLLYILRGLFGGYQAGFSSGAYYQQDQVYARTEFRDIWQYRLALDETETRRLAEHLWELTGRDVTYYFLTKNCAYRLAELLTVASHRPYTPTARVWFAPVELVHGLKHPPDAPPLLVEEPRYFPSAQRQLYWQFARLHGAEVGLANRLIAEGVESAPAVLAQVSPARRVELVDALLAYYEYRLAAVETEEAAEPALREAKTRALRLRLGLPLRTEDPPAVPAIPDPSHGAPPMLVAGGALLPEGGSALRLRYAPYFQDLIGRHSAGFGELVVLDTELRIADRELRLDNVDLVRVRKLADVPDIAGESQWSWQARAGVGRDRPLDLTDDDSPLHVQAAAGIGRARQLADPLMAYLMLQTTGFSGGPWLRGGPAAGLVWRAQDWGLRAEFTGGTEAEGAGWTRHYLVEARVSLSRRVELRTQWQQYQGESEGLLALHWMW